MAHQREQSSYPQAAQMRKFLFIIIPLIAIIAIGGAGAVWYQHNDSESEEDIAANDLSNDIAPATGDAVVPDSAVMTPTPDAKAEEGLKLPGAEPQAAPADAPKMASPSDIHIVADGMDPKSPRSIGKLDAPVTMIEFSSLTCPHCAHAHETVLPQLVKDYVETGKLRIVFSDFPLNQEAMDASKVSRCVANDQYFNFLTMLFGSIEQWAYSGNHPNALVQDATLTGLSEARARECLGDTTLEKAIVAGVQDAVTKYHVDSTPTFVLNDGAQTISGARPYADFTSAIDALIPAGK
jgi:protein-disulfide isomerase